MPFLAIPVLYILMTAPKLQVGDQPELRFLRWCHIIGSISPWVGSFTYHVFMNLERGQQVYRRLLQLDMLGIWICQCFGMLSFITRSYTLQVGLNFAHFLLCVCYFFGNFTVDAGLSGALDWSRQRRVPHKYRRLSSTTKYC